MATKGAKPFKYRGRWRIVVTLENGERPTKDFDKRTDAVLWGAQQTANAKAEHEPVLGGPTRATVAQALDYYARVYSVHKGGVKAELCRINRYLAAAGMPELTILTTEDGGVEVVEAVRRHAPGGFQRHVDLRRAKRVETNTMRDALASKPCSRVTTVGLREFKSKMKKEGLNESTIQKEFAMLKVMFSTAMTEWQWGTFSSPCARIKLGKSTRRFINLTAQEREALYQALVACENPYFWPLVFTAKETTMRRSSLLNLRWRDVDLDERTTSANTKGGQKLLTFTKPVRDVLATLPRDPSGRIFPLSANAVTLNWNRVRERAGLPWLLYQDLRHLGATDWVRRGLTAHHLSKVLGHANITTAQFYVDIVNEDTRDALDAAMENCAPLQLPPPGLPDAKAQQTLNSVNRLQRALAAKRAAVQAIGTGIGPTPVANSAAVDAAPFGEPRGALLVPAGQPSGEGTNVSHFVQNLARRAS